MSKYLEIDIVKGSATVKIPKEEKERSCSRIEVSDSFQARGEDVNYAGRDWRNPYIVSHSSYSTVKSLQKYLETMKLVMLEVKNAKKRKIVVTNEKEVKKEISRAKKELKILISKGEREELKKIAKSKIVEMTDVELKEFTKESNKRETTIKLEKKSESEMTVEKKYTYLNEYPLKTNYYFGDEIQHTTQDKLDLALEGVGYVLVTGKNMKVETGSRVDENGEKVEDASFYILDIYDDDKDVGAYTFQGNKILETIENIVNIGILNLDYSEKNEEIKVDGKVITYDEIIRESNYENYTKDFNVINQLLSVQDENKSVKEELKKIKKQIKN